MTRASEPLRFTAGALNLRYYDTPVGPKVTGRRRFARPWDQHICMHNRGLQGVAMKNMLASICLHGPPVARISRRFSRDRGKGRKAGKLENSY